MTIFTPALLLCLPLWAAACVVQSVAMAQPARQKAKPARKDDDACPTRWASMPFTPPPVHAP